MGNEELTHYLNKNHSRVLRTILNDKSIKIKKGGLILGSLQYIMERYCFSYMVEDKGYSFLIPEGVCHGRSSGEGNIWPKS